MVEPLEPQQTADHETSCQVHAGLTKQQDQLQQYQQSYVTEAQAIFPPTSTRHRPPPLSLHNFQLADTVQSNYTSSPYLKAVNPGCEHDYYHQHRYLTPESTGSSSPLIANVHKLRTNGLLFSSNIDSFTADVTAASVNLNDPASLSTAARKQQQQPQLVPQVEPASQTQPYSRPPSIIHHYPPQHISPSQPQQNHHPYRSPNIATTQTHQYASQTSVPRQGQDLYQAGPQAHYATPAPSQYSSTSTPELMAAAHMQRPSYSQSMYHTPQSTSPTSVASQQNHEYNRIYTTQPGQLSQPLQYGTYTSLGHLPNFGHHPGQSHAQTHGTAGSPLLLSHPQSLGPLSHQSTNQSVMDASPARTELEISLQRPMSIARTQPRSLTDPIVTNSPGNRVHQQHPPGSSGSGGGGGSTGAAPGPIPATTPLVVRQDGNGVQWISFEYSKDKVKLEYTIRCDVESVDTATLDPDFKADNCVYPRAAVPQSQYKGNRFQYEGECNNLGWALTELNPSLRQKRGLIQRAVDSWRNSNANPKMRSRRVRRLAKHDKRNRDSHLSTSHGHDGQLGMSRTPSMALPMSRGSLNMGLPQLHHHHTAQSEGSITSGPENVSENSPSEDIRPSHVFHDYPSYISQQPMYSTSTIPPLHDGLDTLGSGVFHSTSPVVTASKLEKRVFEEPPLKLRQLYGDIPPDKYRKFILMKDDQRKDTKDSKDGRSRIRVQLGRVNLEDIPDTYSKANSVYPRVYYARQIVEDNATFAPRIIADHEGDYTNNTTEACISKVLVPIPQLEGQPLALPRISKSKRQREDLLNEIGYRMLWSNGSTFAGRPLFMQKCHLYRTKTREAILTHSVRHTGDCDAMEKEATLVPMHFRTRIGKQKWLARRRRRGGGSSTVGMSARASRATHDDHDNDDNDNDDDDE